MTAATARRPSLTELHGGATLREIRHFFVGYYILSVVVIILNLEVRRENSDYILGPATSGDSYLVPRSLQSLITNEHVHLHFHLFVTFLLILERMLLSFSTAP